MRTLSALALCVASALVVVAATSTTACSSSNASADAGPLTCAAPGTVTAGAADAHCQGIAAQPVSAAVCMINDAGASAGGDDGGGASDAGPSADACDYGPTMFGTSGDDDDCKYHLVWSATQLCEGAQGVTFTVTVTNKADGTPVTGMPNGVDPEVFIPTDPNADCDTKSTHPSPGSAHLLETSTPGTYSGPIVFDAPGQWTVRFHIHEECYDVLDDSPHGHAAFRVTIP